MNTCIPALQSWSRYRAFSSPPHISHAPLQSVAFITGYKKSQNYFLSLWICFTFLRVSYKWNQSVITLLCWPSFLQFKGKSLIYVDAFISHSFLYCCVVFHQMAIPEFVVTSSQLDGHLGSFRLLVIMSKVAKNINVQVYM